MANYIAVILLVFTLSGCNTMQTKYITVECPEPPVIERPVLDTDYLKDGDDPGTVIQAHRTTIKTLMKWGLESESILNGYRKTQ